MTLGAARQAIIGDVGIVLDEINGATVQKSLEDAELVICGARSSMPSAKMASEILTAPGPVVVTSDRPEVWVLTGELRARVGRVWIFDPQRVTHQPQQFWIDLLATVRDVESAARMASYFVREIGYEAGMPPAGADASCNAAVAHTLCQLLLAAAVTPGKTLRDVVLWVSTRSHEPVVYLGRHGQFEAQAARLRATLELPPATMGRIFEGASTALACLNSEELMRWVTPPSTWEEPPRCPASVMDLDLWQLITRVGDQQPTFYLLAQDCEWSGRAVVTAIVGELIEVAVEAASARGGRLDPALNLWLDKAANIVCLPELPYWISWFGSVGLTATVVLDSREQGRSMWGRDGFNALWSATAIKTIDTDIQDPDFIDDLSYLVSDHIWRSP